MRIYWRFVILAHLFIFLAPLASGLAAVTYPVVDTGQSGFYTDSAQISAPAPGQAFYGQDAQYDGNQPSYTKSADGMTVRDNVTGLTWTQSGDLNGDGTIDVDDKITYEEAQPYVDTLNAAAYGGFTDWRVATIKELYSLIDFRGTDPNTMMNSSEGLTPFIDASVFDFGYGDLSAGDRIIDSQWVTSTLYVAGYDLMFGVNFADGRIKGYGFNGPDGLAKTFYGLFVRGNTAYGQNDFADNGDGTVTDYATGLMWTRDDSGAGMDWQDALAFAQTKNSENHLGYSDWRLPNAKELQSIVDYTRSPDTTSSAAIDPLFNATPLTNVAGQTDYPFYWSSTTHLKFDGRLDSGVYVAFGRGLGYMNDTFVDIHGAGCQRSDPKTGDAADYPSWGNGPQGDIQRVFNYVRLVRDTAGEVEEPEEPGVCGEGMEDTDSDNDGTPDCIDDCPYDENKTSPGSCGCGVADEDADNDGVLDCNDGCPDDTAKTDPGTCGCGVLDIDSDNDGALDCEDGCPDDPYSTQPGACGCGIAETDSDNDGTPNCNDGCPYDENKTSPGSCGCGVADTDSDNDGIPDCNDTQDDTVTEPPTAPSPPPRHPRPPAPSAPRPSNPLLRR